MYNKCDYKRGMAGVGSMKMADKYEFPVQPNSYSTLIFGFSHIIATKLLKSTYNYV